MTEWMSEQTMTSWRLAREAEQKEPEEEETNSGNKHASLDENGRSG